MKKFVIDLSRSRRPCRPPQSIRPSPLTGWGVFPRKTTRVATASFGVGLVRYAGNHADIKLFLQELQYRAKFFHILWDHQLLLTNSALHYVQSEVKLLRLSRQLAWGELVQNSGVHDKRYTRTCPLPRLFL